MKHLTALKMLSAAGLVAVSVAGLAGGCGLRPPTDHPEIRRVILVVVDTLRGDHLACAGGPVATPNLDALAARGVRFSQARTHIPITGPSHSSLFTGLLPSEHGVLNNTQILAEGFETLPEVAQADGMRTAAFISLGVLRDQFGLNQGFDSYDQRFEYSWERNAGQIGDAVVPWLEEVEDRESFLVWAHYSDPHAPYAAPGRSFAKCRLLVDGEEVAEFQADGQTISVPATLTDGRCVVTLDYAEDCDVRPKTLVVKGIRTVPRSCRIEPTEGLYDTQQTREIYHARLPAQMEIVAEKSKIEDIEIRLSIKHWLTHDEARREYGFEVEYVDREIGRLVAALERRGWVDDTLIIFTADHGEGIGDHGLVGHIDQLYDSLLHVPLIMVAPGFLPEGRVVDQPVSLVDIFPTIAELVGFSHPEGIRGRSLIPLMEPGGKLPAVPHVALTARPQADSDLEAVVVDGWKLIRKRVTGEVALFNLDADPGELMDLAPEFPEDVDRLNRILDEYLASSVSTGAWAELDDESRSRLEALGYVN
ncbi:MAG: sulfatase [Acidobacteriota bacterium]